MNPGKLLGIEGDTRLQVFNRSLAIGAAADTESSASVQLDEAYKRCLGVALIERTDGDCVDDYKVAIRDAESRELLNTVSKELIETDKSIGQMDKLFPLQFEIRSGSKIYVGITPGAQVASDALDVDIVFLLWRPTKEDQE